jgi:rare lipoprotein A
MNGFPQNKNKTRIGVASYYDYKIGDWSSVGHYVCATRDFIRYSYVRATNVANGKSVICKVTDYGPDELVFPNRIIDLSSTAFSAISDTKTGIINVVVEQLNAYEI